MDAFVQDFAKLQNVIHEHEGMKGITKIFHIIYNDYR